MKIRHKICEIMVEKSISKNELAEKAGIKNTTLHEILKNPYGGTVLNLKKIAIALEIGLDDLLEVEGDDSDDSDVNEPHHPNTKNYEQAKKTEGFKEFQEYKEFKEFKLFKEFEEYKEFKLIKEFEEFKAFQKFKETKS